MAIWVYNVNPKSPHDYTYTWVLARPETLLTKRPRGWAINCYRLAQRGEMLCLYMKNIPPKPDGYGTLLL